MTIPRFLPAAILPLLLYCPLLAQPRRIVSTAPSITEALFALMASVAFLRFPRSWASERAPGAQAGKGLRGHVELPPLQRGVGEQDPQEHGRSATERFPQ